MRRCLACYTFSFLPAHVHRSVACMRFPKHRIDLHKNTETDPVDSGLVPRANCDGKKRSSQAQVTGLARVDSASLSHEGT